MKHLSREQMQRLFDGEVSKDEERMMETHLMECERCESRYEAFIRDGGLYENIPKLGKKNRDSMRGGRD
ncbi:MAG: zf-HC2 domain-containing protein [bacterium]|jgi:anti-sigma factor RsiW|nr:zf-HC2 domain-containing protein [bacterium]